MNKEPKTLPQAIKIVVGIYGKKVINDVHMVNIMNDVVSLEDPNAVKTILRDCIKFGYGGKILTISPYEDCFIKIKTFSKQISDSYGYKEVIVQYVLYSLAYGIGICPNEPYVKNIKPPKTTQKRTITKKVVKEIEPNVEDTPVNRKIPYKSRVFIVIVLLLGIGYLFNYLSSASDRELFENKVFSGDSFMYNGDYNKAVDSYKEAYNSYNAMNSSSYKEEALEKIDALTDKLYKDGQLNTKSLSQALQLTRSELQLNLDKKDRDRIQAKLEEIEKNIIEKTENGRNMLITNISANGGKLDEAGKIQLLELLELSPNDYWLNFIKKKSYE